MERSKEEIMNLEAAEKLYKKETKSKLWKHFPEDSTRDSSVYYDDDFVTWLASKIPEKSKKKVKEKKVVKDCSTCLHNSPHVSYLSCDSCREHNYRAWEGKKP
jgi:hypothetical protein